MEDETTSRLDRAAMMHGAIRCLARFDIELAQQPAKRDPRAFMANTDPDRAIFIMRTHGNHRPLEARVCHSRHCQQ
jgi:hypothetical protein